MADQPLNPHIELSPLEAEVILHRWLGHGAHCLDLKLLTGGCCTTVLRVDFDDSASPVVLKLDRPETNPEGRFAGDFEVQRYFREHTDFPVPEPFAHGALGDVAWLLMEFIPGGHLGQQATSEPERAALQREMGEHVAALHTHTVEHFGGIRMEQTYPDWSHYMRESLLELCGEPEVERLLSPEALAQAREIAGSACELLDAPSKPTLVHGDLWATNIMVDGGRITGYVDPGGHFAHPEYELAYLEIWRTADDHFFDAYHATHPRLPGYERRRSIYWLNTLLVHVWLFQQDHYIRSTEELLQQIQRA